MHTDLPIGRGAEITWQVSPGARLNLGSGTARVRTPEPEAD